MDPRQQRRADVLSRLEAGKLSDAEASGLLGVSVRQIRRLKIKYKIRRLEGLVHGNTGRAPANQTESGVKEKVLELAGPDGPYHDFNVCHTRDLLKEMHDITVGRSTLDRLLKESGARKPRRRKKIVKRTRRERLASEGQTYVRRMLQVDGSPHDWLEGRAAKMCLMGAIDDATGKIVYLRFHKTEDQAGYLMLLRSVCTKHGVPMSIYHDKHTILRSPKQQTLEEELANERPMSQVQRVMDDLGIESIAAHSPQAKGRVERSWRTLQDRLVKEMRLAGTKTMEEANAFLSGFIARHNARFTIEAADASTAWVSLGDEPDLDRLFSTRELRTVANDHTVSVSGTRRLILRGKADKSLSGRKIAVHETPEGTLCFYDGTTRLQHTLCKEPLKARETLAPCPLPQNILDALKPQPNAFKKYRAIPPRPNQSATP